MAVTQSISVYVDPITWIRILNQDFRSYLEGKTKKTKIGVVTEGNVLHSSVLDV